MVAPVSVTVLADLSAQPVDSSVEPAVGEVVTAAAVPLEPTPITRTSVRLTSRIARIRRLGTGGSLLAAVNDMRGLLSLDCCPPGQHDPGRGRGAGRFDRGVKEVPRRRRSISNTPVENERRLWESVIPRRGDRSSRDLRGSPAAAPCRR